MRYDTQAVVPANTDTTVVRQGALTIQVMHFADGNVAVKFQQKDMNLFEILGVLDTVREEVMARHRADIIRKK